ncbi:MAG TPA: hypothetical protein VK456_08175 [Xanthobacteraceae bacterium]|nr:hypothetical protein [Xanthobacteraceae bacterium]
MSIAPAVTMAADFNLREVFTCSIATPRCTLTNGRQISASTHTRAIALDQYGSRLRPDLLVALLELLAGRGEFPAASRILMAGAAGFAGLLRIGGGRVGAVGRNRERGNKRGRPETGSSYGGGGFKRSRTLLKFHGGPRCALNRSRGHFTIKFSRAQSRWIDEFSRKFFRSSNAKQWIDPAA